MSGRLVDHVSRAPPQAFAGFRTRLVEVDDSGTLCARHELYCSQCGGHHFTLQEMAGELGVLGVLAECAECGNASSVFNAAQDGYDGVLGHLAFLKSEWRTARLCDADGASIPVSQISCVTSYSCDEGELLRCAEEEGIAPQDLFDWITIEVAVRPGVWRPVWDAECA